MEKMTKQKAEWIYKAMHDIRNFEDEVHRIFTGEIPRFVHLYAVKKLSQRESVLI